MNKNLDAIISRYLGYAVLLLLGAYLLFAVSGTLPIFIVGGLLAYAFEPLLQRLEKRGYSRGRAVFVVFLIYVLFVVIVLALLAIAWQQVQMLINNAEIYRKQALAVAQRLQARFEHLPLPANIKNSILASTDQLQKQLVNSAPMTIKSAPGLLWSVIGSVGNLLILSLLLPIITFTMMIEMNPMRARLMTIVPPAYRRDVTEVGQSINEVLGHYVRGQMIVCSLFGLLCTIAFELLAWRFHMGYPLILGLMATLLYIIPYFGLMTVAVAATATAYFTAQSPNNVLCAVLALGSCVIFNLIMDYGVSPRVLGKGVGLHPLMVIFALLSGFEMGGIPGMVLAVPLFASLRVILIYIFPQLTAPAVSLTPPEVDMKSHEQTVSAVTSKVMQQIENAKTES